MMPARLSLLQPGNMQIDKDKHRGVGRATPETASARVDDLFLTRSNHPLSRFPEMRAVPRICHVNIHETKDKDTTASMS